MSETEAPESQTSPVAADDSLPPVEAPGMGFIMQLFFIPLLIVMIIVMMWLMFSYFAHMGTNPRELVTQIERLNDGSWQEASTLADLLNNPQNQQLKYDRELAGQIANVLERELEAGSFNEKRLKLRMFLCLALGEFKVDTGLPALLEAAETMRNVEELPVRQTAIQALAPLISNLGAATLHNHARLHEVLLEASREKIEIPVTDPQTQDPDQGHLIREAAAYTLGVLGSEAALDRLSEMIEQSKGKKGYSNTVFNAAVALARNGDPRAETILLRMLNPKNDTIFTTQDLDPRSKSLDDARQWKRSLVLTTAMEAAVLLSESNPEFDPSALRAAIVKLTSSETTADGHPLPLDVTFRAKEALERLEQAAVAKR